MLQSHAEDPQLWFRESLCASLSTLVTAFKAEMITATIRLGVRNFNHPKGYVPDQIVMLRVLDGEYEVLKKHARIVRITSKRLRELTSDDLKKTVIYVDGGWDVVQRDLSIFERYDVDSDEMVSIVEFEYVHEGG